MLAPRPQTFSRGLRSMAAFVAFIAMLGLVSPFLLNTDSPTSVKDEEEARRQPPVPLATRQPTERNPRDQAPTTDTEELQIAPTVEATEPPATAVPTATTVAPTTEVPATPVPEPSAPTTATARREKSASLVDRAATASDVPVDHGDPFSARRPIGLEEPLSRKLRTAFQSGRIPRSEITQMGGGSREESIPFIPWDEYEAIPARFSPRPTPPLLAYPPCEDSPSSVEKELFQWGKSPKDQIIRQLTWTCSTKIAAYNLTLWTQYRNWKGKKLEALHMVANQGPGFRYYWRHMLSMNSSEVTRFRSYAPSDPMDWLAHGKHGRILDPLDPMYDEMEWLFTLIRHYTLETAPLDRFLEWPREKQFKRKFKYAVAFGNRCTGNVYHQFMSICLGIFDTIVRRGWQNELDEIAFIGSTPGGGKHAARPGCPINTFPYGYDNMTLVGYAMPRLFNIAPEDFWKRFFVVDELAGGHTRQNWKETLEVGEIAFEYPNICQMPLTPGRHALIEKRDQQPYAPTGRFLRPWYGAYDNHRYQLYCLNLGQTLADRLAYFVNREMPQPAKPKFRIVWQNRKNARTRRLLNDVDVLGAMDKVLEEKKQERENSAEGHQQRTTGTATYRDLDLSEIYSTNFDGKPQNERFRYINETAILITARGAGNLYSLLLPPGSVFVMITPFFEDTVNGTDNRIQSDQFPWLPYGTFPPNVTLINVHCEPVECPPPHPLGLTFIRWHNSCHLRCRPKAIATALRLAIDIVSGLNEEKWAPLLEEGTLGSKYFFLPTEIRENGYEYYKADTDQLYGIPYS